MTIGPFGPDGHLANTINVIRNGNNVMRIIIALLITIQTMTCACSSYIAGGNRLDKYDGLYAVVLQHHIANTMPVINSTIHIYLAVEDRDPSVELLEYLRDYAPSIKNRSELKPVGTDDSLLFEEYSSDNKYF